jgi:hypothetical protein
MQPNQFSLANRYDLSGKHLHITYLPHGTAGKPQFSYQDLQQTLSFSGDEIRSAETEIGMLVSVTLRMTVDTGGTTFSVLLPHVDVPAEQSSPIQTFGITTLHKFSILPVSGQHDFYTVTRLHGSASILGPTPAVNN